MSEDNPTSLEVLVDSRNWVNDVLTGEPLFINELPGLDPNGARLELARLRAIEEAAIEWSEGWDGERGENQADRYFLAVLDANKKTPA